MCLPSGLGDQCGLANTRLASDDDAGAMTVGRPAEDLRQRLTTTHRGAELHEYSCDAAGDERRDDDLFVGIGLDGTRNPHR